MDDRKDATRPTAGFIKARKMLAPAPHLSGVNAGARLFLK